MEGGRKEISIASDDQYVSFTPSRSLLLLLLLLVSVPLACAMFFFLSPLSSSSSSSSSSSLSGDVSFLNHPSQSCAKLERYLGLVSSLYFADNDVRGVSRSAEKALSSAGVFVPHNAAAPLLPLSTSEAKKEATVRWDAVMVRRRERKRQEGKEGEGEGEGGRGGEEEGRGGREEGEEEEGDRDEGDGAQKSNKKKEASEKDEEEKERAVRERELQRALRYRVPVRVPFDAASLVRGCLDGAGPPLPGLLLPRRASLSWLLSPIRRPSVVDEWSPYDIGLFEAAICAYGKKFYDIAKIMGGRKTTKEIIEFYYIWKKTSHYKLWKKHYRMTMGL